MDNWYETFTARGERVSGNVWRTIFDKPITINNGDLVIGHLVIEGDAITEDYRIYRKGTWIPTSSPPAFDEMVLVIIELFNGPKTTTATYRMIDGGAGWYFDNNPYSIEDFAITHWQPLPSPVMME